MTYLDLIRDADRKLDNGRITLGEYEKIIEPLKREIQPEIIRCKDCKHRDKYGCCKYWKGLAMADIPIATDDYDFCSYAK